MAKNVITIHPEDTLVPEGTVKSNRGAIWGLTAASVFLVIMAALFVALYSKSSGIESPADPAGTQEAGGP